MIEGKCVCCTCGYEWSSGQVVKWSRGHDGSHSCSESLIKSRDIWKDKAEHLQDFYHEAMQRIEKLEAVVWAKAHAEACRFNATREKAKAFADYQVSKTK